MRTVFKGKGFKVTYTVEASGEHFTWPDNYCIDTCVITVMLKGSGSCCIEGEWFPFAAGDIAVIRKNDLRCFSIDSSSEHERMSFYLGDEALSSLVRFGLDDGGLFHSGIIRGACLSGKCETLCADIRDRMLSVPRETEGVWEASLFFDLMRLVLCILPMENSRLSDKPKNTDVVYSICEYVRSNIDKPISYADVERELYVSRYQLTDVFSRRMGMTLTEFITIKRLGMVASLVGEGIGIESAALKAGFCNYSHFYKAFKRHFGQSPRKYFTSKQEEKYGSF